MRCARALLGGLMLVALTAEMAPGANPCGVIPLYTLNLRCRDGAACDLDRSCDGTCLVAGFHRADDRVTSAGVRGCYETARLFTRPPRARAWLPVATKGATAFTAVRTGPAETWDGLNPARLRYKCRPARRSCVPPPAEGTVAISGSYPLSHFAARAYVARPLGGLPDPYFQLFVLGDESAPAQHLFVLVGSTLSVGSFSNLHSEMSGELQVADDAPVERELLTDAELTISAIEPSDTDVSVVHGTFRGTFMHDAATPVVVEATF